MAIALLQILPVIVLFFSAQKYFIGGIQLSGLSGR
jgi:ABC-type maltose transport system permease subunit